MIERTTDPFELPDWFVDLVVLRATDGLSEEQNRKFESFVAESANRETLEQDIERLELSVAAAELAGLGSVEAIPDSLRNKVLIQAGQFHANGSAKSQPQQVATVDGIPHSRALEKSQRFTRREAMGWLAAAACVALLFTGWNPFAKAPEATTGQVVPTPPSTADQMAAFLETKPDDLVDVSWAATPTGAGATGQVFWSDQAQEGYMVFDGLKPNTPTQSQYQLWIFDTNAAQKYPVDGGVFDVAAGKTIVRIDAKIAVKKAVQFAITEEKPGGVVVSDRKRLPLLATLQ